MIKKFIEDNNLDFTGSGSELNGNCVILAGYALHKGLIWEDLEDIINTEFSSEASHEFDRVFTFAEKRNYGKAWETEDYKKKYIY